MLKERLRYLLRKAAACGLTIMTGTDVVGSIPREVALLAEFGLPPHAALAAASTSARQFLGFTSLHEGEPADLVTYGRDPSSIATDRKIRPSVRASTVIWLVIIQRPGWAPNTRVEP